MTKKVEETEVEKAERIDAEGRQALVAAEQLDHARIVVAAADAADEAAEIAAAEVKHSRQLVKAADAKK